MGEEVAELCHKKYEELGKSGKPGQGEWTTLGGVVIEEGEERWVASLATGTKCLGHTALQPDGVLLSDSHSEVLARRGLLNYLYDEIEKCFKTGSSKILSHHQNGKCCLKPSVKFHFYCSHVPCGDASIIEMTASDVSERKSREQDVGPVVLVDTAGDSRGNRRSSYEAAADGEAQVVPDHSDAKKMKLQATVLQGDDKLSVLDEGINSAGRDTHLGGTKCSSAPHTDISDRENVHETRSDGLREKEDKTRVREVEGTGVKVVQGGAVDVFRTGGKCVGGGRQDPQLGGVRYHVVGAVRTKPGRGDPTLSLSCSDKITRWLHTGLQGGLVSLLLEGRVRLASITVGGGGQYSRAALTRALSRAGHVTVALHRTSHSFPHSRYRPHALRPSPTSLLYSLDRPTEVAVEGRKQGVTKKSKSIQLSVSRKELFKRFLSLAGQHFSQLSYFEVKATALDYRQESTEFKKNIGTWTTKPPMDFRNE